MIIDRYIGTSADSLKRDRGALLSALKEAGGSKDLRIRGNELCCPFCSDSRPSAGIYTTNGDGLWRFKCQRTECGFGGSIIDVIARVDGLDIAGVFRRLRGVSKAQNQPIVYKTLELLKAAMPYPIEAIYHYTDPATGKVDMYVFRLKTPEGKKFIQAMPVPGGFVQQAPAKPRPLYNRKRLQSADTVIVVEGEKCVHILHKYEFIATTSPGGKGSASHADWTPLAGKRCILWPDADGIEYMEKIAGILQSISASIHIINPADLGLSGKDDVEQYIQMQSGDISEALIKALDTAKAPKSPADKVGELIDDVANGKIICIPWKWPFLSKLTKALKPESSVIICGGLGASKSFKLLESMAYWHNQGIKVAFYELEESREFHLLRSLAQESGTAMMTDYDWIRANPEQAKGIFQKYKSFIGKFGLRMKASPIEQPTLNDIASWSEEQAKAGCRIIGIDPITAAAYETKEIWKEDKAFLHQLQQIATKYLCSFIIVTHPTKTGHEANLTYLAGGAAYQRFAQTILWIQSHDNKTSKIRYDVGSIEEEHNRTLHILKARHAPGQGKRLAYRFSSDDLKLAELGIILRK